MQSRGFEDTQSAYMSDDLRKLVGQVRRLGEAGPAYEVIGVEEPDKAVIEVVYSGEVVTCKLKDVLEDPMAETIP
jgi:hypothetical protein